MEQKGTVSDLLKPQMRKKKKSVTAIDHASSFLNSWECPKLIFTGLDKAGEIDTKKKHPSCN